MNHKNMRVLSLTYKGKDKKENEDSYFIGSDNKTLVIGDGSSGCNGKISSQSATGLVGREIEHLIGSSSKEATTQTVIEHLKTSVELAHNKLRIMKREAPNNTSERYFQTTLDVIARKDDKLYFAHLGDSRIYLVTQDNKVISLTKDQRTFDEKIMKKDFTPNKAKVYENQVTSINLLGMNDFDRSLIQVGSIVDSPKRIVLMTDGLTDIASEEEINYLLANYSGEKLLKKATELYRNPQEIHSLYFEHNDKLVKSIVEDYQHSGFSELQFDLRINTKEKPSVLINKVLNKKKNLREMVLEEIKKRENLSEKDDFTMLVLEEKKGLFR